MKILSYKLKSNLHLLIILNEVFKTSLIRIGPTFRKRTSNTDKKVKITSFRKTSVEAAKIINKSLKTLDIVHFSFLLCKQRDI